MDSTPGQRVWIGSKAGVYLESITRSMHDASKRLEKLGVTSIADRLVRLTAELELQSPDLQNCWGGPLNGQEGRMEIVSEIIGLAAPMVIVETGSYRGISTLWFAQQISGLVLSCEIEKVYFLQAQERVKHLRNVELHQCDSLSFLKSLSGRFQVGEACLFYLDAHWYDSLPLREEVGLIFNRLPKAVVMIDDFRVPDDAGYTWDDYGPGKRVDAVHLEGILPLDANVYLPKLSSEHETGPKRGFCAITLKENGVLASSKTLRPMPFSSLLEITSAMDLGSGTPTSSSNQQDDLGPLTIQRMDAEINLLQTTCDERLDLINKLGEEIDALRGVCEERLEVINTLNEAVSRMTAERSEISDGA